MRDIVAGGARPADRFGTCDNKALPGDAGVAKLADAQDLKSWDSKESCGFDSRPRHQIAKDFAIQSFGRVREARKNRPTLAKL